MENKEQEDQPIEDVKLDLDKVRALVPKYTSEKLCEMIAVNRYFEISTDIIVMCMEELAARRVAGDAFAFEKYIEESQTQLVKLPPLPSIPDLRSVLQQMTKVKK